MDKRKYLIYVLLGFFLNFSSLKTLANNAWLPEQGQYKVAFSNSKIDRTSKEFKEERVEKFLKIEQKVEELVARLTLIQNSSKLYSDKYSISFFSAADVENYTNQLKDKITLYKAILCVLSSYHQYEINSAYIEYAPKPNMSFGIDSYIKENVFANSKYTSTKYKSFTKSAGLFYKYKVFQNKNLVLSIQPKIIFDKHSIFKREEIFHEISILAGATKQIHNVEFFTQAAVTYGGGSSNLSRKKKHHTYEYSEGFKLPYGLSVVKFTKHYERKNHGYVYDQNVYEQFSVAKKFEFGNLRSKNFTIQLGYFWDYSLKGPRYEVSGTLLSLWSEI